MFSFCILVPLKHYARTTLILFTDSSSTGEYSDSSSTGENFDSSRTGENFHSSRTGDNCHSSRTGENTILFGFPSYPCFLHSCTPLFLTLPYPCLVFQTWPPYRRDACGALTAASQNPFSGEEGGQRGVEERYRWECIRYGVACCVLQKGFLQNCKTESGGAEY